MLKKCFFAVIIALLMTSSQIAAAAPPVDWSKVQRISSKTDLVKYIEDQRKAGEMEIAAILTNGLFVDCSEFIHLCPSSVVRSQDIKAKNGEDIYVIYKLLDYPGTKVANAYLSGTTLWLTPEEKELYKKAIEIVDEAKKRNSMIMQEVCIYENIIHRSQYYSRDMSNGQERFTTAIGVLIDGQANCQGYTDAFYMLGRMMGWNVGRMSGKAKGGAHAWNTITFPDGKTYFVDATFGDASIEINKKKYNDYIYFNAPLEIIQETHSWESYLSPTNPQPSVDDRFSYCVFSSNLARRNSVEAGIEFLGEKLKTTDWASVMVPFDQKYFNKDALQPLANKIHDKCGKNITIIWWKRGNYMFMQAVPR